MEQAKGAMQFYRKFLSAVDDRVISADTKQCSKSEKEPDSSILEVKYLPHDITNHAATGGQWLPETNLSTPFRCEIRFYQQPFNLAQNNQLRALPTLLAVS